MCDRYISPNVQRARKGNDVLRARIDWLKAEAARTEPAARIRREAEELAVLSMRAPLAPTEAFARFGMLLGLLPPAAIFHRIQGYDEMFPLLLVMNVVCCAVGRACGSYLFRQVHDEASNSRLASWMRLLLASVLFGFGWGVVTGASGGVLFFGIGALFGIICAVPVGVLGYAAFTLLHAAFARGGLIEADRLWPIAFGVSGVIAALVLGA